MIYIILQIFISTAFAINITDGCDVLSFSENDVDMLKPNSKCTMEKAGEVKFVKGGKLYNVKKINTENVFCKIKVDEIFEEQNKRVLSFLEKSSELITHIGLKQILENDVEKSKNANDYICKDFPDIVKIKSYSTNLSKFKLPRFLDTGILAIPNRLSNILFISSDFKKIEWSMNFPGSMVIKDALLSENGRIAILYLNNLTNVNNQKTCLSEWDIISGNKLTEFCFPKKIDDEAIYSIGDKIYWIFSKGKFIVAKKYMGNESPEFAWKIENISKFKLANSYISENSTTSKK